MWLHTFGQRVIEMVSPCCGAQPRLQPLAPRGALQGTPHCATANSTPHKAPLTQQGLSIGPSHGVDDDCWVNGIDHWGRVDVGSPAGLLLHASAHWVNGRVGQVRQVSSKAKGSKGQVWAIVQEGKGIQGTGTC